MTFSGLAFCSVLQSFRRWKTHTHTDKLEGYWENCSDTEISYAGFQQGFVSTHSLSGPDSWPTLTRLSFHSLCCLQIPASNMPRVYTAASFKTVKINGICNVENLYPVAMSMIFLLLDALIPDSCCPKENILHSDHCYTIVTGFPVWLFTSVPLSAEGECLNLQSLSRVWVCLGDITRGMAFWWP